MLKLKDIYECEWWWKEKKTKPLNISIEYGTMINYNGIQVFLKEKSVKYKFPKLLF